MRFTANTDISELAKKILDAYKAIAADAERELAKLDDDTESRADVIEQKKAAIYDDVRSKYETARKSYGAKIDSAVDEVRRLAATIRPQQPTNAAVASILQVLQLAPSVNQQMLDSAAENVGGDLFAHDCIRQVAQRHGLQTPHLAPVDQHLRSSDLDALADDLTATFRNYFDCYAEFIPERAKGGTQPNTQEREITMTRGRRSNADYSLERIGNGAAFRFSDPVTQAEFDAAAATTEL